MNFTRHLFTAISIIVCFICFYSSCYAQTDHNLGNWNAIFLKGKISPKWFLMGEGHIRSSKYDLKFDYFEVKTGIGYSITKNISGLFGTGFFNTYESGELFQTPAKQKEFRTWFELNLKQTFNRFYFEHRGRIEQRFIGSNYKNRLKYRLALSLPLNKAELVNGSIYLAVNDELFMPQNGPFVEKNRFFAGAGYKINGNTALQFGCVNDTDYKLNDHSVKNYLQLMLFYDFSGLVKKHN